MAHGNPGFLITSGKGFHITFENGWTVSVQFGGGNYGDNYHAEIGSRDLPQSGTAEIAAWDAEDNWHEFSSGNTVDGYKTPAEVLAFMNMIAAKPRAALSPAAE